MKLGNIFLVGAAKAGTTTLYQALSRHPEICSPIVKEPNYYSNPGKGQDIVQPGTGPGDKATVWTNSLHKYRSLYRIKDKHRFIIDGSVSYFYSNTAASRIRTDNPDARIIIILRNPVDRAWSHYKHLLRDGRESVSFEQALALEDERQLKGWEFSWHLRKMGLYSDQILRYLDCFGRDKIQFFLFDDLKTGFNDVLKSAADFADLSDFEFDREPGRDNMSGLSRSRALARMVNWVAGYKVYINKVVDPSVTHSMMQKFRSINVREGGLTLNKDTRDMLVAWFREDIGKTEQLIGRDLSAWKN
ncbi:sulfotransferase family protein [Anseongella ginsenosidimutans]|uniref:Sulfotransferase family protein n=1 Tax=Anseongella ginsenosidimutans TaxID=496056 RepID=A0A4R3KSQ7_9SPHI|nr:sulfotransferase [Anseongella ginsenosidimutans]QEC53365.1 sulfotransferase [Anseongella ginsenosidimutans]TCS88248.1 sulfotransferase family protein [Anseongella ginsenosidimutans]